MHRLLILRAERKARLGACKVKKKIVIKRFLKKLDIRMWNEYI